MKTARSAFTLIEVMGVLVILAITATLAMDLMGNTEASMRANRAAREAVTAIKYARSLAITTGGVYGVEFDTANARFQVFQATGSNVVGQPMSAGGTYVINLSNAELRGTTMTPTITGDAANPYDITFAPLGTTTNSGTIVFTYAGFKSTVTIPTVGEPTIN